MSVRIPDVERRGRPGGWSVMAKFSVPQGLVLGLSDGGEKVGVSGELGAGG